jgi:hypothetical protein
VRSKKVESEVEKLAARVKKQEKMPEKAAKATDGKGKKSKW